MAEPGAGVQVLGGERVLFVGRLVEGVLYVGPFGELVLVVGPLGVKVLYVCPLGELVLVVGASRRGGTVCRASC